MRLSRYDMLTTSYLGRYKYSSDLSATDTYSLGYTRKFGSLFEFGLTGSMILNRLNSATDWGNADIRADAKLGLRF